MATAALQAKFVAALAASPAFTGTPTAPTPAAGKERQACHHRLRGRQLPARVLDRRAADAGHRPDHRGGMLRGLDLGIHPVLHRLPLAALRPSGGRSHRHPLASEVDAVGGELSKTDYARLWGYARENNLVVSDAVWTANRGAHYFADVSGTTFRVPDLRNMFRRYTGTDADTANARVVGSKQRGTSYPTIPNK